MTRGKIILRKTIKNEWPQNKEVT